MLGFVFGRAAGPAAVAAGALAALLYVQALHRDAAAARVRADAAEVRADGAEEAALKVAAQARALQESRDRLARELREEERRIRAAAGACLDEGLPAELLD